LEIRYDNLKNETERVTEELRHALAVRELCCADFERAQRWISDAEVQTAPESTYTASSISELELSLQENGIDMVILCGVHHLSEMS